MLSIKFPPPDAVLIYITIASFMVIAAALISDYRATQK